MAELLVANRWGQVRGKASSLYAKAPPPRLGEQFAPAWAGENKLPFQLPGGGVLLFDLDRLTLQDFRAMRNHYQINVSLRVLMFMIHQVDWRITCTDERIRSFVEDNLAEVWTRLVRGLSVAYWAGYAPLVIQYENDGRIGKIKANKFKDIEPENARVHWKEVDGYAPRGYTRPKIKVFDGIEIHGQQWPVPVENSLWYPLLMESGDYYGTKLLKPAFPSWFFSQIIHLFANRYFERFGEPIPVGRAPFDEEVDMGDGTTASGKQVMETVLAQIRNRSAVVLPNDRTMGGDGSRTDWEYSLEYLESQMRGVDFERYLNRLDEEMSLGIFTPVLLYRTADVGSYNLGEAHMQIFLIMVNALIGDMVEYINRYLLDRLVDFNFSPNAPRAYFTPRKLGKEAQATLRAILQAMITQNQATVDVQDLGEALGLKVHEIQLLTPEPAPAGPDGDGGDDDGEDGEGGQTNPPGRPGGGREIVRTTTEPSKRPRGGDLTRLLDLIVGRVAGQVRAQMQAGTFGSDRLYPGYSRKLEEALMAEGTPEAHAKRLVGDLYGRLAAHLDDLAQNPPDGGPDEFVERFRRELHHEFDQL